MAYPIVQGCDFASQVTTEPFLCSKGIFFPKFFCVLFFSMHCVAVCSALASKHRNHASEKALLLIVKTKVNLNISASHIGFYQTIKSLLFLSPTLTKAGFHVTPRAVSGLHLPSKILNPQGGFFLKSLIFVEHHDEMVQSVPCRLLETINNPRRAQGLQLDQLYISH